MALPRYLIDGRKVEELRHCKDWTQQGLAARSKVSRRTIINVELEKGRILSDTAERIANAFDTSVESLTKSLVYPNGPSEPPNVVRRYREQVNRARDCDLAGNHAEAIALCQRLLAKLGDSEPEQRAIVVIHLATFLDNAGQHTEALAALDELIPEDSAQRHVSPAVLWWATYHRGIALRRLGKLDDAEREFQLLLKNPIGQASKHGAAAKHQLGAIHFHRSRGQDGRSLDRALEYFLESGKAWQQEHNHRQGFALRRVGQVYALKQRYAEAIEAFFEAVAIFSRCRCHRYVEETRDDLHRHVFSKVQFSRRKKS